MKKNNNTQEIIWKDYIKALLVYINKKLFLFYLPT